MLYRNDINIVRGMTPNADFRLWHFYLVGYVLIQALLGFLIVNEIYSRRADVQLKASKTLRFSLFSILLGTSALGYAAYLVLPRNLMVPAVLGLAVILGVLVAIQAAIVHVFKGSNWVYAAGTAGVLSLLACASLNASPELGFLTELTISGTLAGAGFLIFGGKDTPRNRPRGKHRRTAGPYGQPNKSNGVDRTLNGAMA
jgi:hypothetical protein